MMIRCISRRLEQIRYLCRIANNLSVQNGKGFATAMHHVVETGRMLGGWRRSSETVTYG